MPYGIHGSSQVAVLMKKCPSKGLYAALYSGETANSQSLLFLRVQQNQQLGNRMLTRNIFPTAVLVAAKRSSPARFIMRRVHPNAHKQRTRKRRRHGPLAVHRVVKNVRLNQVTRYNIEGSHRALKFAAQRSRQYAETGSEGRKPESPTAPSNKPNPAVSGEIYGYEEPSTSAATTETPWF